MARTRYAPDRGLTVRMTVTMFLLGLVFVAFVAAIIGILTAVHASGAAIVLVALIFGGGSAIASLFYSDKIALSAAGARVVTPQDEPELHAIVDRLCALADMDKPRVAIAPTRMPNAFATGRNSKNSVLCVTEGLMYHSNLTPEEKEGVLAHELSHVAHKDVQVMTVASLLAIVAGLLVRFAFYSELFGGGRRSSNNNQGGIPVVLIIMAVSVVVYAVSFLLIRVLSRYRELAADRSGALLTGQPSALASALTKVSQGMSRIPNEDLRAAEPLNAFYFAPAMKLTRGGGGGGGGGGGKSLSQLFSTHPSLEKRLEQLAKIQRELGQPTAGRIERGPGRLMGFLDTLLGRTKPVQPKLDDLFALPSAAITLQASSGFIPTGSGSVCFRSVEGKTFSDIESDVRDLLNMDAGKPGGGLPVEVTRDSYGYTWLVSSHLSDELDGLVTDLHAVNSALVDNGFGPQLLCTLVAFRDERERRLALVYLYKRGTFYPFAPLSGQQRDNALEIQIKNALADDLKIEQDLTRWFPVWGAPGM